MSFNAMDDYWEDAKARVNNKLKAMIADQDDSSVKSILDSALQDGKRVRSTLVLLICEALEGDVDEALGYAALIETVHASSLVVDDVIDGDDFRRNNPSLWNYLEDAPFMGTHGKELTVFSAEGFVALALQEIKSIDALKIAARGIFTCWKGAVIECAKGAPKDISAYLKMIEHKTAALFEAAALLGAVTSEKYEEVKGAVASYGKSCGIAFQLADDILDKEVHKDVKDPMVLIYEHVSKAQRNALQLPDIKFSALLKQFPDWMVQKKMEMKT